MHAYSCVTMHEPRSKRWITRAFQRTRFNTCSCATIETFSAGSTLFFGTSPPSSLRSGVGSPAFAQAGCILGGSPQSVRAPSRRSRFGLQRPHGTAIVYPPPRSWEPSKGYCRAPPIIGRAAALTSTALELVNHTPGDRPRHRTRLPHRRPWASRGGAGD